MSKKNDGGPAFPIAFGSTSAQEWAGMTLRDYFAAQVVGSIMLEKPSTIKIEDGLGFAAKLAYMIADAMLKARDQ